MRCVVARPMGCQAVLLPRGHSGRRVPVGRRREGLRQWVRVRGPPEGTPELGWPPKLCPPCREVGQNEGHSERPRGLPQQDGPCTPRARAGARGLLVQKRWRVSDGRSGAAPCAAARAPGSRRGQAHRPGLRAPGTGTAVALRAGGAGRGSHVSEDIGVTVARPGPRESALQETGWLDFSFQL